MRKGAMNNCEREKEQWERDNRFFRQSHEQLAKESKEPKRFYITNLREELKADEVKAFLEFVENSERRLDDFRERITRMNESF